MPQNSFHNASYFLPVTNALSADCFATLNAALYHALSTVLSHFDVAFACSLITLCSATIALSYSLLLFSSSFANNKSTYTGVTTSGSYMSAMSLDFFHQATTPNKKKLKTQHLKFHLQKCTFFDIYEVNSCTLSIYKFALNGSYTDKGSLGRYAPSGPTLSVYSL